jgi:hypothetical protein
MNYPLRYYFDEGFLTMVYWASTDPRIKNKHPFTGVYLRKQITASAAIDENDNYTLTVEGVTYKLDENFYLDYGVFFHSEAEARSKAAEIVADHNSAGREYIIVAKPQLVDAEL